MSKEVRPTRPHARVASSLARRRDAPSPRRAPRAAAARARNHKNTSQPSIDPPPRSTASPPVSCRPPSLEPAPIHRGLTRPSSSLRRLRARPPQVESEFDEGHVLFQPAPDVRGRAVQVQEQGDLHARAGVQGRSRSLEKMLRAGMNSRAVQLLARDARVPPGTLDNVRDRVRKHGHPAAGSPRHERARRSEPGCSTNGEPVHARAGSEVTLTTDYDVTRATRLIAVSYRTSRETSRPGSKICARTAASRSRCSRATSNGGRCR